MKSIQNIKDLFWQDMENHSIKFANWIAKNNYEKIFKGKKSWITWNETEDGDCDAPRYTIKEVYDKFMIDYLCS